MNFTIAAEILYITQPVLSRHIKVLENEIGVRLFVRTRQSVKLTEEGRYFIELANNIVKAYDEALDKMRIFRNGFSADLKIGILYYAINQYLTPVLDKFKITYPNINISIFPSYPIPVIENLLNGLCDVGMILNTRFKGHERFEFQTIRRESLFVAMRYDHHLNKMEGVQLKDIFEETFIDIDDFFFNSYSHYIYLLFHKYNLHIKKSILTNNLESAILAAQSGEGIIILPSQLVDVHFSNIVYLPIMDEACYIDMSIAYKPENENTAIYPFIDLCVKTFS